MTLLLLQMTTAMLTALVFGWVARKFGQARVIGEVIGGIFLGPSAFGRIAPHASASLFPQSSLGPFDVLSIVGLILFLFLIGSQLEYEHSDSTGQQRRSQAL
jgi:Kef-type K+ transport system membrane component KefB